MTSATVSAPAQQVAARRRSIVLLGLDRGVLELKQFFRNRSAAVRIPMYFSSEKSKRLEFRTPDPTCNPYLSFAACLMAGLDGVQNKIDPGQPLDKDLYELPAEEAAKVKQLPGSLDVVLDNLEKDHEFLLKGDVFTRDFIETWLEYKRKNEVDAVRLRPHPWEFALYFDI